MCIAGSNTLCNDNGSLGLWDKQFYISNRYLNYLIYLYTKFELNWSCSVSIIIHRCIVTTLFIMRHLLKVNILHVVHKAFMFQSSPSCETLSHQAELQRGFFPIWEALLHYHPWPSQLPPSQQWRLGLQTESITLWPARPRHRRLEPW